MADFSTPIDKREGVAFVFNGLGTASQIAVRDFLDESEVRQLFSAFGVIDSEHHPWTLPFFQLYAREAAIYARYTLQTLPHAKVAILYQNDDLGRTYLKGFTDALGLEHQGMVVKTASDEMSEPAIDDEVITLQASGADVLLIAASPKFAAQAIRKAADLGWNPTRFISVVSSSIVGVLKPAGLDNARNLITAISNKDVSDPQWKDDADVKAYSAFIDKYMTPTDLWLIFYSWSRSARRKILKSLQVIGAERGNVVPRFWQIDVDFIRLLTHPVRTKTESAPTFGHASQQKDLGLAHRDALALTPDRGGWT